MMWQPKRTGILALAMTALLVGGPGVALSDEHDHGGRPPVHHEGGGNRYERDRRHFHHPHSLAPVYVPPTLYAPPPVVYTPPPPSPGINLIFPIHIR